MMFIKAKKVFQSLLVVSIAILLHGCGYTKPSAELVGFMSKIFNIFFSFGYFVILFGIVRVLWGKRTEGLMALMMGTIFLSAAYIGFVAFTVIQPDFNIELVIPFMN